MLPVKFLCSRISFPEPFSLSPAVMLATCAFTVQHRGFSLQLQEPPMPDNTTKTSNQLCLTCGPRNRLHYETDGVLCSKESHEKFCFSQLQLWLQITAPPITMWVSTKLRDLLFKIKEKRIQNPEKSIFHNRYKKWFRTEPFFHYLFCFSLLWFKCPSKHTSLLLVLLFVGFFMTCI